MLQKRKNKVVNDKGECRMLVNSFVQNGAEICRVLLETDYGFWMISYDSPARPFYVVKNVEQPLQRVPPPKEFANRPESMSPAEVSRMQLILPLVNDERCITEKTHRKELADSVAAQMGTSAQRVIRLYYRYLATGQLVKEREPKPAKDAPKNVDFDWAIRTFYFSAKRHSLKAAFELMLLSRYTDEDGNLAPDAPTWSSFSSYFYRKNYHKKPRKSIARKGLTNYQRNERPAFGSSSSWRPSAGCYQMDATLADIYLVSKVDRSRVIGRPSIYIAVDTATQLIAGIHVGMEPGEPAVIECLAQAAADKVEYCKRFGIDIEPEQWPSRDLPTEIVSDKGREFFGARMEELCRRYGVEIQNMPPFRPDQKGIVEKTFDLLQARYKPHLRGKGVIEQDAQERWAVDYRTQAVLTLEEFTVIVLYCVIYINSGRLLSTGRTSAQMWEDTKKKLLPAEYREIHQMALPRTAVKLSRRGFHINHMWYVPESMDGLTIGDTYTLAYDPSDTSYAFVVAKNGDIPCALATRSKDYSGLTLDEAGHIRRQKQMDRKAMKQAETRASIASIHSILSVVEAAEGKNEGAAKRGKRQLGEEIKRNSIAEKELLS